MQAMWVPSPVRKDSTCHEAAQPERRNYQACVPKPGSCNYWAQVPQLLKPPCARACALQQEKAPQWETCLSQLESSPCLLQLEKSPHSRQRPSTSKLKNKSKGTFPGGLVVKTLPSNARDADLNPAWRTKIPHSTWRLSHNENPTQPSKQTF